MQVSQKSKYALPLCVEVLVGELTGEVVNRRVEPDPSQQPRSQRHVSRYAVITTTRKCYTINELILSATATRVSWLSMIVYHDCL